MSGLFHCHDPSRKYRYPFQRLSDVTFWLPDMNEIASLARILSVSAALLRLQWVSTSLALGLRALHRYIVDNICW